VDSDVEARVRAWVSSGVVGSRVLDDWAKDLDSLWSEPIPPTMWAEVATAAARWIAEELQDKRWAQGGVCLHLNSGVGPSFRFAVPDSLVEITAQLAIRHPPTLFVSERRYPMGYPMEAYQKPVSHLFEGIDSPPILAYYQEYPDPAAAHDRDLLRVVFLYDLSDRLSGNGIGSIGDSGS
jgi:hypothetical protein